MGSTGLDFTGCDQVSAGSPISQRRCRWPVAPLSGHDGALGSVGDGWGIVVKVMVATAQMQGERNTDFDYCIEGELVWIGMVCADDRRDPDGECGCGRSFAGMNSHRATTTARVADVGMDFAHYAEALRSSLKAQGWPTREAIPMAGELADIAADFPIGAVLERRLDEVRWRVQSPALGE